MVCKLTIFLLGPPSLPEPPTRGWRKVRRWKVLTGRPNRRRKVRRRRCAPSRTSSPTSPSLSDESSSTTTTIRRNWMRRRRTKFSKINATNWKSLNFSELEFNAKQVGPLKVLKSCWSFFAIHSCCLVVTIVFYSNTKEGFYEDSTFLCSMIILAYLCFSK